MTDAPDPADPAGAADPAHGAAAGDLPHGSVGEEAAKLADAVHDWLSEWRGAGGLGALGAWTGGARASGGDPWAAATAEPSDGAECRMCPICMGLRLLRGAQPEVFEHLSEAAASMAAALRELIGDPAGGSGAHARPGVERIDLG